ncbi:MAG: flagellar basal body-associated FliL family protein [Pseudomonadota bacterium]
MSETTDPGAEASDAPPKSAAKGILIAIIGALVAGGGGFAASYIGALDGLIGGGDAEETYEAEEPKVTFLPMEPLIVSLGPRSEARSLKFTAQLEVMPESVQTVSEMLPRVRDVLNTYLRAVEEAELQDPASLPILRAQMLRRIQIVLGDGYVRDLLIMEFILN